jgi:hypothetical protein
MILVLTASIVAALFWLLAVIGLLAWSIGP